MTQSNQTAQTMEDGLKPVNLFDAVPYIAQTRFENEFNSYDDVDFRDISKGIKQIFIMTSRELPKRFWEDHYYKTVNNVSCNLNDYMFMYVTDDFKLAFKHQLTREYVFIDYV